MKDFLSDNPAGRATATADCATTRMRFGKNIFETNFFRRQMYKIYDSGGRRRV